MTAGAAVNTYAGETDPKKSARYLLYSAAMKAMCDGYSAIESTASVVGLSGPTADEYRALRLIAAVDASRVVMVDRDSECCAVAARAGADVVRHGAMSEALEGIGPLKFVHLDFMGELRGSEVARSVQRACHSLVTGGVLAVTFLRGRDTRTIRSAPSDLALRKIARMAGVQRAGISNVSDALGDRNGDIIRMFVYFDRVNRWSSAGKNACMHPIKFIRYHSGKSPMGVLVFKKAPLRYGNSAKLTFHLEDASNDPLDHIIDDVSDGEGSALPGELADPDVKVIDLVWKIAEATTGWSRRQLAARRAWRTMRAEGRPRWSNWLGVYRDFLKMSERERMSLSLFGSSRVLSP